MRLSASTAVPCTHSYVHQTCFVWNKILKAKLRSHRFHKQINNHNYLRLLKTITRTDKLIDIGTSELMSVCWRNLPQIILEKLERSKVCRFLLYGATSNFLAGRLFWVTGKLIGNNEMQRIINYKATGCCLVADGNS